MIIALIAAAIVAATLAATAYFRHAAARLQRAGDAWAALYSAGRKLVEDEQLPMVVREFARDVLTTAGCGCYVAQMIVTHLRSELGREDTAQREAREAGDPLWAALTGLSDHHRKILDTMFVQTIVFDALSNPIRGWIMGRVIRTYRAAQPVVKKAPKRDVYEAKFATIAIHERKSRSVVLAAA